jgi:betaine-aldehyde dehydrogenase
VAVDDQAQGHQWVDGALRTGAGGRHKVVDPATGETVVELQLASRADVDAAVAAAVRAQPAWGSAPPAVRSGVLHRLAC